MKRGREMGEKIKEGKEKRQKGEKEGRGRRKKE
jgi:hypothetical protein